MRLLLHHPEVATRSCGDCQKWLYDDKTGERVKRAGRDIPRPKGVPTPCSLCPKRSPEEAPKLELSHKNLLTLQFYYRSKAVEFRNLSERWANDPIIQRNFAAIENELKQFDRKRLAEEINAGALK